MQSLTFLQLYEHCKCKCNYASVCVLQADMHRQVHVHAGMPCKFNQYFARNYPEALSHCGHGHDLTSVAELSVITSAFDKTLASSTFAETPSKACHSRETRQRRASRLVYIYIYIIIIRVHHVQKYTRAILPHAALCHS